MRQWIAMITLACCGNAVVGDVDQAGAVVIFSGSNEKASKVQDRLIKTGYSGIINGGDYEELHNALYDTRDDPAE